MTIWGEAKVFFEASLLQETDECIIWPFSVRATTPGKVDYPQVTIDGKSQRANVVVCRKAHGDKPSEEHHAAHKCGNNLCINKRHVSWATPLENAADKFVHGTQQRGEDVANAILTAESVKEIRLLAGSHSHSKIAKMYGVSRTTITNALSGKTWGWVS